MIIRIILYFLAALSFIYGYIIFRIRSGAHFFLVWWMIGVLLVLTGIGLRMGFFDIIPKWMNVSLIVISISITLLIGIVLIRIISFSTDEPDRNLDYIIVLGAQVRENGPSKTLLYRLKAAEKYLKENTGTICIVSGGRGKNEIMSEAEAMKRYLISAGIDENRIIMEDESTDTDENIRFSKKYIRDGASVGLVTNDFHLCRGIFLCEKHGLKNVSPVRADSEPFYRPNNYFREALAFIKDFIFR